MSTTALLIMSKIVNDSNFFIDRGMDTQMEVHIHEWNTT